MHSSSTGPSDSERSSGLPCMRWPLQGLRRLWVPSHPPLESSRGGVRSSVGGSGSSGRPRWSRVGSAVAYTPAEVRALTPVRESVEKRALLPDLRDVFLCHAWDDRRGPAKELHDLLESLGVSVWFSEKDVVLGSPLLREIDKGLEIGRAHV